MSTVSLESLATSDVATKPVSLQMYSFPQKGASTALETNVDFASEAPVQGLSALSQHQHLPPLVRGGPKSSWGEAGTGSTAWRVGCTRLGWARNSANVRKRTAHARCRPEFEGATVRPGAGWHLPALPHRRQGPRKRALFGPQAEPHCRRVEEPYLWVPKA